MDISLTLHFSTISVMELSSFAANIATVYAVFVRKNN